MARKVFISFLGTGEYFPVYYTWNKKRTTNHRTPFIQEALVSQFCKGWGSDDAIMIFRTKKSNDKNWVDTTKDGVSKPGLQTVLSNIPDLKCKINPTSEAGKDDYIIPVGFSEDEIWQIFNKVFEKLNQEDEIYFDVTHAFRTIPMFTTVLFNHARFLKQTRVKGVYYGAFESLGSISDIMKLPEEKQSAPIVDLINMVMLQEINTAAYAFRDFGAMGAFSGIINDTGINELDSVVNEISGALSQLDFYIQTCRIEDIRKGEYMNSMVDLINAFHDSIFTNEAQSTLISEIYRQLCETGFVDCDSDRNVEAAIKWAIDHNMIQQAYTMAMEYLVSKACRRLTRGMKEVFHKNKFSVFKIREAVGRIMREDMNWNNGRYVFSNPNWRDKLKAPTDSIAEELIQDSYFAEIQSPFQRISFRRNKLNHASTDNVSLNSFDDYKNEFTEIWGECVAVLKHHA